MFSVSFTDLITDKLLPFSMKMKESPFTQGSALCLVGDNSNFNSLNTELMDFLFGNSIVSHDLQIPVQRTKIEPSYMKYLPYNSIGQNKFSFSPHVYKIINDSIRFLANQSDMLLCSSNNLNISNMLHDQYLMKPIEVKEPFPNSNSLSENKISDILDKMEPELKMTVTVRNLKAKSDKVTICDKNFNVPSNVTLNLELVNRKTKELQKRSKKRRRRLKKGMRTDNFSALVLEDGAKCSKQSSPVSSPKSCSKTSKNKNGFVVSVEHMVPNLISSFVVSVGNDSDGDSDWDSCSENDIFTGIEDFEFDGLVVTNLNSPTMCFHPTFPQDLTCDLSAFCENDQSHEIAAFEAVLVEVNKNWNEATKDVNSNPKFPSKVSFAPDDELVEILPVEFCERKGEWEIYATERLRFKRRIDELENIISPCLELEHRLAVFKKNFKPRL